MLDSIEDNKKCLEQQISKSNL